MPVDGKAIFLHDGLYYKDVNTPKAGVSVCPNKDKGVVSYPSISGDIIIPDYVNSKPVVSISKSTFMSTGNGGFRIVCPNTLIQIQEEAFRNSELISISLNEGLTGLGNGAFSNCVYLYSINIPSTLKTIPKGAFRHCSAFTSIKLPSGSISIGEEAFYMCSGLVSITCPVEIIYERAFFQCLNLSNVDFGDANLTTIGESAFARCNKLEKIQLPSSLQKIGSSAFAHTGLKEITNNSTSPQEIQANVFEGVDLSECILYVPKGCKAAYQAAKVWKKFGYILEPGEQALKPLFEGEKLAVIDGIPYSLNGTKRTAKVVSDRTNPSPSGKVVLPATVNYEGNDFTFVEIGDGAFCWNSKITELVIPNTVVSIGKWGIKDCENLQSVTLSASLESIGEGAFYNCKSLKSVTLPVTLKEMGDYVFEGCESLTSISIPAGIKVIGYGSFSGCSNLTKVNLPNSLETIEGSAFNECEKLRTIVLPASLKSIDLDAFRGSGIQTIKIDAEMPPSVKYVEETILENCLVQVPSGSLSAYQGANGWKEFKNLREQGFNEKIKYGKLYYQLQEDGTAYVTYEKNEAGNYADLNGEITVEKTVTYQGLDYKVTHVGPEAFRYATGITKVNLPAIMDEIRTKAFNGCTNLARINMPATMTWLADDAFGGTQLFNDNKDANGAVYYDGCLLALTQQLSGEYSVKEGTRLIATNVFENQESLTSLILPEGLGVLCNSALSDMPYLKTITLPSTLWSIGGSFLHNCYRLTDIYNYNPEPVDLSETYCFDGMNQALCTLYVPKGSKNAYAEAAEWKDFVLVEMDPKSYTVTFEDWDGQELKSETVEVGSDATAPADPEREGYTFTGWDKEFTNIQSGLTVTAQYERNKYTVIFLDWDESTIDTQEVLHGESATAPADPTRDGYTFTGWDKEFDIVNGSMNVTAQYAVKVWTVTYLNWDNSLIGTEQVEDGQDAKGMVATRVGWIFGQWYNTKNFEYVDLKNITSDMTVKAEYSGEILFDVIYRVEGVTTFQIQAVYGFDASKIYYNPTEYPKTPEKASDEMYDYTFSGWEPEVSYITENVVLTAQFEATPRKYTVSFYDWDDSLLGEQEVAYGSAADAPTPERTGYTFTGWDKSVGYITGNLIVKAQYTINSYSVTFVDWDDAVLRTAQIVEYGAAAVPPADPVRTGYTFTGWDQDYKNVTGDMTVKAQYTINQYTVRFLNWDGTVLQSSEWEYNSTPVYSGETPLRAEDEENTYAFAGWDKEIAAATADADYTAQFTATAKAVYFTVTYYDWDLTILGTEQVEEGHDAQGLNPEPTRDGYTFTGWSKPLTNITSDLSVQAQYEVAKVYFTVTYYDWDLTILGTEQVEEGHDAQGLNPEPTRDGYTFTGWSKPLTNITSDLSVQATYKENPGTGIDEVESQKSKVESTKVLRDGVLYIMHNETLYNVQGQRVK